MKRYIFPVVVVTSLLLILSACSAKTPTTDTATTEVDALRNSQPQKQADIQWTVKSIVGNDFTIETIDMSADPLFKDMQSPEFRTKMQTMSDTERQAFMTQMQEARAKAKKIQVVVTIPVGIPILVRTGGGGGWFPGGARPGGQGAGGIGASLGGGTTTPPTGQRGPGGGKQGTIADIKVGGTVNIWLTEGLGERKVASWISTSSGGQGGGWFGGGGFGGGQPPTGGQIPGGTGAPR